MRLRFPLYVVSEKHKRRHLMKRKGLYFLIALALGGVGAVHAQDAAPAPADSAPSMSSSSYDDRWYIAPTIGGYYNDTDRNTNSRQIYYGLGVGRFISPNASIDIFADRTKRDVDSAVGAVTGRTTASA
jgi:OOP family OmpA-OmpF porin